VVTRAKRGTGLPIVIRADLGGCQQ
jgi:hypothetical protein